MGPLSVAHTIRIDAPAARVRPLLEDLFNWPHWSPWDAVDPQLQRQFSGQEYGIGAKYAWQGDRRAGAGDVEITECTEHWITCDLHLDRPWRSHNRMRFVLLPGDDASSTELIWTLTQETSGFSSLSALVLDVVAVVGQQFTEALTRIQQLAEGPAA